MKDAEWIAELLRHGLLRASFIPPRPQRDLRDLTRQRTNLVQDRAQVVNRLQKVLEWANLKLSSVATDVTGASARAMLAAIIDGETDAGVLAELAQGRMRSKRAALEKRSPDACVTTIAICSRSTWCIWTFWMSRLRIWNSRLRT